MFKYYFPTILPHTLSASLNPSPIHRDISITRVNDLIRVVTLDRTVAASGSLTYLVGCGIASTTAIRLATSSIVWCLQRPQVMLSWCCGMMES